MALNIVQLLEAPGGPGVIGGVQAGAGVAIAADGTISTTPGVPGVTSVTGSSGVSVTASTGNVTVNAVTPTGQPFPAGTTILVLSASAPTGYTKLTTQDNYALRVVTGTSGGSTGGSIAFTSAFANVTPSGTFPLSGISIGGNVQDGTWSPSGTFSSGSAGLSSTSFNESQNPAHNHTIDIASDGTGSKAPTAGEGLINLQTQQPSDLSGDSNPHTHSVSWSTNWNLDQKTHTHPYSATSSGGTGNFTGNSINLSVKYVDAILCSKN